MSPGIFIVDGEPYLLRFARVDCRCLARRVQETRTLWCETWGTYTPHTRTSQGWVCCCGELAEPTEEQDERNSRPFPF